MKIKILLLPLVAIILAASAACAYAELPGLKRNFTYKKVDGAVEVYKEGKLFTRFVYANTEKPYLYPLYSPSGIPVTREYPMKNVPQNQQDHPHHRSLWIGLQKVNDMDFWTDGEKAGRIKNSTIDFNGMPGYWAIHTYNYWIGPDGKNQLCEDRNISFLSCDYGTVVSTMIEITACQGNVTFGATKDGFFALRMAPGLQLKDGTGHLLNSEGMTDSECWGKRAKWCDYTGEVGGKAVGVTMFDSPMNYNYPTYWHARDYGLLAANPFGGKDFTGNPADDSPLTLKSGESATFIYAVLIHDGKLDKATLDDIANSLVGRGIDKSAREGSNQNAIEKLGYTAREPEKKPEPQPANPASTDPTAQPASADNAPDVSNSPAANVKPVLSPKPAAPAKPAAVSKPAAAKTQPASVKKQPTASKAKVTTSDELKSAKKAPAAKKKPAAPKTSSAGNG